MKQIPLDSFQTEKEAAKAYNEAHNKAILKNLHLLTTLKPMNYLYLLTRPDFCKYDEYDSAIVCAANEEDAREIHPSGDNNDYNLVSWSGFTTKEKVIIKRIGIADDDIEPNSVICASFNAG
jgi:hypothetical protein